MRCLAPSVGVVPQLLSVPMLQVEEWQPTFTADAIAPYFPGGGGRHDEAEGRTVSTKEACGIPSLSQDARTHYCAHACAHTYAHAQSQACAFHEHANDSCQQNARSIENICGAASTPIRIQEACGIPLLHIGMDLSSSRLTAIGPQAYVSTYVIYMGTGYPGISRPLNCMYI